KGLSMVYGRDPPRVSFVDAPADLAVRVSSKKYKVKVRVEDDGPVRDLYLFNGDQKVVYERVASKGPTEKTFEAEIQLKPGVNVITAVAREDDEFAQREVLTVFSEVGDPLA